MGASGHPSVEKKVWKQHFFIREKWINNMKSAIMTMIVSYDEPDSGKDFERWMDEPPTEAGRGEVLFDREAVFPNGKRMSIQVIASENPDTEPCWTQGVLFDEKGNELGRTDVGDTFYGEYIVFANGITYHVEVVHG
jgi:hypothetical protein